MSAMLPKRFSGLHGHDGFSIILIVYDDYSDRRTKTEIIV